MTTVSKTYETRESSSPNMRYVVNVETGAIVGLFPALSAVGHADRLNRPSPQFDENGVMVKTEPVQL